MTTDVQTKLGRTLSLKTKTGLVIHLIKVEPITRGDEPFAAFDFSMTVCQPNVIINTVRGEFVT